MQIKLTAKVTKGRHQEIIWMNEIKYDLDDSTDFQFLGSFINEAIKTKFETKGDFIRLRAIKTKKGY
jgi:ferritin